MIWGSPFLVTPPWGPTLGAEVIVQATGNALTKAVTAAEAGIPPRIPWRHHG